MFNVSAQCTVEYCVALHRAEIYLTCGQGCQPGFLEQHHSESIDPVVRIEFAHPTPSPRRFRRKLC